jgi:photosystem II stability/assembly factor-like uncharacterized protein
MNSILKYLGLLILLLIQKSYSQSLIYPDITKDYIKKIVFVDTNTGFLINTGGTIYKTIDGGITWSMKYHITGGSIEDIKFLTNEKGFAFSRYSVNPYGGVLLSTVDGGETWKTTYLELVDAASFQPLSDNLLIKSTNQGEIKLLDNYYNRWVTTYKMKRFNFIFIDWFNTLPTTYDGNTPYGSVKYFQRMSDSLIYAFGSSDNAFSRRIIRDSVNFVLKSIDNGVTWDTLWVGFNFIAKKIVFVNDRTWWLWNESDLFKTNNFGKVWEKINILPDSYLSIADIFCLDTSKVLLLEQNLKSIYYSPDGGASWNSNSISMPYDQAHQIYFLNLNKGFAFGRDLYVMNNNLRNWNLVSQSIRDDIIKIDFINRQNGWAIGTNGLYFTNNGGKSWLKKDISISKSNNYNRTVSLKMTDSLNGWLNNESQIFRTIDGGENWELVNFDSSLMFGKVEFHDKLNGVIYNVMDYSLPSSRSKSIFSTTDGGITWNNFPDTINQEFDSFYDVKFSDNSKLWGVNSRGLWLSTDFGKSWSMRYSRHIYSDKAIYFLNHQNGFVVLNSHEIIRTRDGGITWEYYYVYNSMLAKDLLAIGPNMYYSNTAIIVFCPGFQGEILKIYFGTNDNTFMEKIIPAFTSQTIHSFSTFIENKHPHVWIAGDGFTILYREYETIISSVNDNETQLQINYNLLQNYPNPFNPTTTIKYSIPAETSGHVAIKLKVYDLLGSEVAVLVNEEKPPGNYEVKFDGSGLPSGIYFYRLQAGGYTSTRKMLLIK